MRDHSNSFKHLLLVCQISMHQKVLTRKNTVYFLHMKIILTKTHTALVITCWQVLAQYIANIIFVQIFPGTFSFTSLEYDCCVQLHYPCREEIVFRYDRKLIHCEYIHRSIQKCIKIYFRLYQLLLWRRQTWPRSMQYLTCCHSCGTIIFTSKPSPN